MDIVLAHKGCVRWKIETHGRAAHSSMPQGGINAISKMAKVLDRIDGLGAALRTRRHELTGHPTFNVGRIVGGMQANIVPENCVIDIDRRLIPGESPEAAQDELLKCLEELRQLDSEFEFTSHLPYLIDFLMETSPDEPIVQAAKQVVHDVVGGARTIGVPFGTDASKLAKSGIPSIVLGPGSITQAHSIDEHVPVEQL